MVLEAPSILLTILTITHNAAQAAKYQQDMVDRSAHCMRKMWELQLEISRQWLIELEAAIATIFCRRQGLRASLVVLVQTAKARDLEFMQARPARILAEFGIYSDVSLQIYDFGMSAVRLLWISDFHYRHTVLSCVYGQIKNSE